MLDILNCRYVDKLDKLTMRLYSAPKHDASRKDKSIMYDAENDRVPFKLNSQFH